MSFRDVQQNSLANRNILKGQPIVLASVPSVSTTYVRNPSWPALPTLTSGNEKFVGLYAIYPNSPYIALTAVTSGGAQYTVNWGDGTSQNVNSNTQANYLYDFNDVDLANTNAPVTFTDSTDTVGRNNHGYTNGMLVSFAEITTTTGITRNIQYYVVNATTNTFQLSLTEGGSVIPLTNNGTGVILPYKIAIVEVAPVSGNLARMNLMVKNTTAGLRDNYGTGWLDISFSMTTDTTGIIIGSAVGTVRHSLLQKATILKRGTQANFSSLFINCQALQSVTITNSGSNITNTSNMFSNCFNLRELPSFNTSTVTNMASMFSSCNNLITATSIDCTSATTLAGMFSGCTNLREVSLVNVANVTSTSSMFSSCSALTKFSSTKFNALTDASSMFLDCRNLQVAPYIDAPNLQTAASMFSGCIVLAEVPSLVTTNVTNMNSMFLNCNSLKNVALFDTGNVTNMDNMFSGCDNLTSLPLFNTSKVTTISSMFNNCFSLPTIPLFDFSNVTIATTPFANCTAMTYVPGLNFAKVSNATSLFSGLTSLESVGLINISNVTNATNMFSTCLNLVEVPLLNTSNVTNMSGMFSICRALNTIPNFNTINVTNMTSMFNSCFSLVTVPLLNTSNLTIATSMFSGCSSLISVPLFNLSNITTTGLMFNQCFSIKNVNLTFGSNYANGRQMFDECRSLESVSLTFNSDLQNGIAMFRNCGMLQSIDLQNTKPWSMTSMIENNTNLQTVYCYGGYLNDANPAFVITPNTNPSLSSVSFPDIKYSFSVAGCKLSGTALNNLYTDLANIAVTLTLDGTTDVITWNNHGFSPNTASSVIFANVSGVTGITAGTTYWTRNVTTNTFQISTSQTGGTILNFTGTGTANYQAKSITVTNNVGTASDNPTIATSKGWTVTGS